ncbi:hypothetical protein Vadar_013395 [Vaccinium darrowii]|uniref:Uncharacterized protein n=1 Tax=Vaccinium darrowii TaxID=229202 RepID=A0ACB7Y6C2_9ERIC|nr:hypothetical protein Vadar_013395 [Vaccinium darrowii]
MTACSGVASGYTKPYKWEQKGTLPPNVQNYTIASDESSFACPIGFMLRWKNIIHRNNCELRSVVIVDRGMIGSDFSTTNYPGKIPSGLDLPSDVTKEKHPTGGVPT